MAVYCIKYISVLMLNTTKISATAGLTCKIIIILNTLR